MAGLKTRAINRFYSAHDPAFAGIFKRNADRYRKIGLSDLAADHCGKACLLDPADAEAAQRLKEMTVTAKQSR